MPGFGDKEVVQSAIEGLASLDIVSHMVFRVLAYITSSFSLFAYAFSCPCLHHILIQSYPVMTRVMN